MDKNEINVLIVDDEEGILDALKMHLEMDGYLVDTASSAVDAVTKVENAKSIHILLTDINMPKMDGIELLEKVKAISPTTIVIMITAYTSLMKVANSRINGATDYLLKPFRDLNEVDDVMERAYHQIDRWNKILAETMAVKRQNT